MQHSAPNPVVLVVDDDLIAREIVATHLRQASIDVVEASSVKTALAAAVRRRLDLVVLDINLPDGDGFGLGPLLQSEYDVAIIYITSRGATEDRLRGLENGGDDYLVKPVDMRELLARVRVVLRRRRRQAVSESETVVVISGWMLDLVRRELTDAEGHLVQLTRAEFDLFAALYHSGRVPLHRDYLLEVVASADSVTKSRTIDVMISRIRRKLAAGARAGPRIVTKMGEGYLLLPHGM
jgi:two-component system torCAD operon response regulator TorR